MTTDEARTVGRIAVTADEYCTHCASKLIEPLMEKFPEHKEIFAECWEGYFEEPWEG